jgi:hypothetical protein
MRRGLIIRLLIALLAGLGAAVATYETTSRSPPSNRTATHEDSNPGPLF